MSGFPAPRCGSLRAADAGHDVELYGAVARRREHGGLTFIDLRDRWGVVQVVFSPERAPAAHDRASALRSEYVVRVSGRVERRPASMENPNLETGEIEVHARELDILSVSKALPFPL